MTNPPHDESGRFALGTGMTPTIRLMRASEWVAFVILVVIAALLLSQCGDDDVDPGEANKSWFVTTDPYGREFTCLVISNGSYAGGGLFCVAAP